MIVATCGLLGLLFVLDLYELHFGSRRGMTTPRLSWPAIGFLAGVATVYCALEAAGTWLMPRPEAILDATQQLATGWSGVDAAGKPSILAAWGLGISMFYTAGLWDYVVHRHFSHSRWFWFTHEYHHLPRQVCLFMPGILGRPFAALPSMLTIGATAAMAYALIWALGLPLWDLRAMLPAMLAILVILTASHSSFLRRIEGLHQCLRWACITTPQEHLLHHAAERDGNYGNFTTLWDRVFGTYLDPRGIDLEAVPLGLDYDQDFLGALTGGWLKLPAVWRRRFQVSYSCRTDSPGSGT